jgi:hypothetical protein
MKTLFTSIIVSLNLIVYSQTVGINSGVSYGRFYDVSKNDVYLYKEYQAQPGISFGIEVKDIATDTLFKLGIALNYQNYGGHFLTRSGSHGGFTTEQGEITKHVIGIELYPFHFKIHRHIRFNFGISYNRLITYKLSGTKSWWYSDGSPLNIDTGTTYLNQLEHFVNPYYWGLISSLGYEFKIGKITVEPRYSYYLGISQDFNRLNAATSSMRHNFVLSIGYCLK